MIILEAFTSKDFKQLISWVDSSELLYQFAGPKLTYPLTETQLENILIEPQSLAFVVKNEENQVIGHAQITIKESSFLIRRLLIGESSDRNKKYGQHLVKELLHYGFSHFIFDKAELNVFDKNKAAIRCYEKVGFILNPKVNYSKQVGDEIWSSLNMTILRDAFLHKA